MQVDYYQIKEIYMSYDEMDFNLLGMAMQR